MVVVVLVVVNNWVAFDELQLLPVLLLALPVQLVLLLMFVMLLIFRLGILVSVLVAVVVIVVHGFHCTIGGGAELNVQTTFGF